MGRGRIDLNRLRLASSRCSAGELISLELEVCARPERPRVKSCGLAAMVFLFLFVFWGDAGQDSKSERLKESEGEEIQSAVTKDCFCLSVCLSSDQNAKECRY